MRTVIINTLGPAFTRKDVFYRAFAPDELQWLNYELDALGECAGALITHARGQVTRQDYNILVLVDLEHFELTAYRDVRERMKDLLTAYINFHLLPELDAEDILPKRVTAVFTYFSDRADAVKNIRCIDLLHEGSEMPERLALKYRPSREGERELDFTDIFADALKGAEPAAETPEGIVAEYGEPDDEEEDDLLRLLNIKKEPEDDRSREANLNGLLLERIKELRVYKSQRDPGNPVKPRALDFRLETKDPRLANADIQINLSRVIYEITRGGDPQDIELRPHTPEELGKILADALKSAEHYSASLKPRYYELREQYELSSAGEVESRIRGRLKKELDSVPGVRESIEKLENTGAQPQADANNISRTKLEKDLRDSWIRVGRAKSRFREGYRLLREQYDKKRVLQDQESIQEVCVQEFMDWRAGILRASARAPHEPRAEKRPVLSGDHREDLMKIRENCAKGVLEKLDDFADVREEGAALHTKFRALTRVWSPDRQRENDKSFFRFSVIMALTFVLVMVLPFLLIESAESGATLPKIALCAIYYGLFLALYTLGVLRWMRELCRGINSLTVDLMELMYHSADARRDSIIGVIETYGRTFPQCLIVEMNLDAAQLANEMNERIERYVRLHMEYLEDACNEIMDMRTALKLPESREGKANPGTLAYDQPPYAPANQRAYMLFLEEGEVK